MAQYFEWDEDKDTVNQEKHEGISFMTAALVFDDPQQVSRLERIENGEERWQTIGRVEGLMLLVVHTWVDDDGEECIRIISARRAEMHERAIYEGKKL